MQSLTTKQKKPEISFVEQKNVWKHISMMLKQKLAVKQRMDECYLVLLRQKIQNHIIIICYCFYYHNSVILLWFLIVNLTIRLNFGLCIVVAIGLCACQRSCVQFSRKSIMWLNTNRVIESFEPSSNRISDRARFESMGLASNLNQIKIKCERVYKLHKYNNVDRLNKLCLRFVRNPWIWISIWCN